MAIVVSIRRNSLINAREDAAVVRGGGEGNSAFLCDSLTGDGSRKSWQKVFSRVKINGNS